MDFFKRLFGGSSGTKTKHSQDQSEKQSEPADTTIITQGRYEKDQEKAKIIISEALSEFVEMHKHEKDIQMSEDNAVIDMDAKGNYFVTLKMVCPSDRDFVYNLKRKLEKLLQSRKM